MTWLEAAKAVGYEVEVVPAPGCFVARIVGVSSMSGESEDDAFAQLEDFVDHLFASLSRLKAADVPFAPIAEKQLEALRKIHALRHPELSEVGP